MTGCSFVSTLTRPEAAVGSFLIPISLVAVLAGFGPGRLGAQTIADLDLHEVPSASPGGRTLGLFLSGDGGWAPFDRDVARALADHGISVVGLNARSYLATRRTPEAVAGDAERILRHYLASWDRDRIVLIGYSRGAVIAPFIVNRLPADLRAHIDLVAMLGLGYHAGFHVSLLDLLHTTTNAKDPPVAPEIATLAKAEVRMMCIYGVDEAESYCRDAPPGWIAKVIKRGAHHFDGDHNSGRFQHRPHLLERWERAADQGLVDLVVLSAVQQDDRRFGERAA